MPVLEGRSVLLRPVEERDADVLISIHETPEVAAWWGPPRTGFPFDDDAQTTRLAIFREGEVVGLVEFGEELDPDYRHAWVDVFVDPARHRQGVGTDAVGTVVRHLTGERGHHRVTIDPAVDNHAAIRCYEGVGFSRVGVMRRHWRDRTTGRWRDGLLMELVLDPADPEPGQPSRPAD